VLFYTGLQTIFAVVWLPGALFYWSRKGLRGQKQWQFIIESFWYGLIIVSGFLFLFSDLLIPWLWPWHISGLNVLTGLSFLAIKGFVQLLKQPFASDVLSFIVISYVFAGTAGQVLKWSDTRKNNKPFSIRVESAFDTELFRIRDRKEVPIVTVYTVDGLEIKGKCRVYTFSEPREIVLEEENQGKKTLRWLRINNNVQEIKIEAIPWKKKTKVVNFKEKQN